MLEEGIIYALIIGLFCFGIFQMISVRKMEHTLECVHNMMHDTMEVMFSGDVIVHDNRVVPHMESNPAVANDDVIQAWDES